jgi:hypothetical protein
MALLVPWAVWVQYYQGLIPYFETGNRRLAARADISLLRDLPQLQLTAGLTTANTHAWLYYLFWTLPVVVRDACRVASLHTERALGRRISGSRRHRDHRRLS